MSREMVQRISETHGELTDATEHLETTLQQWVEATERAANILCAVNVAAGMPSLVEENKRQRNRALTGTGEAKFHLDRALERFQKQRAAWDALMVEQG